ncbi:bifunctional adenosylcobinamide kinase/adenosylcobinamide-phosphate guanylyltransferase [Thermoleophilum album]|uniref:bifunctional adenosylcobinamide kinase/adenosylcobinamide-phosphate guanylyltransferase n=1 Tax=Thermoleophilum album TaxID=29539 RepID=UPI00237C905B|nr:bifunctional adenosylcobinamide kinase/adenosylcobinamide-phosphate guanylyltransferase [Thermoleophilum album]WDT93152.1 bifunctional adenosylcobinamide kinase/adenosylcobinamide-phosphate guanylyltransferase [Thermoleophilum album]
MTLPAHLAPAAPSPLEESQLVLVLGGVRSGKSERGEAIARASGLPVTYLAFADPDDQAMAERIARHRARRPPSWEVVEVGDDLAAALASVADRRLLLVDGLGTWIATVLHRAGALAAQPPADAFASARERVTAGVWALAARAAKAPTVVVAEQAGEGVLPPDAGSRLWLDLVGDAVRTLADRARTVELVVAGRPLPLGAAPVVGFGGAIGGVRGGSPRAAASAATSADPGAAVAAASDPQLARLRKHGDSELAAGLADHAVTVAGSRPPAWLYRRLREALDERAARYPDERAACSALAAWHGRDPAEIVPTNGGAEALWLLAVALRPRLAAVVTPSFTEAEAGLRTHGVAVTHVVRTPQTGFALDARAVPETADLVVVTNPAAASGTLAARDDILALRRPGRVVVVDEAFVDFAPDPDAVSLAPLDLPDVVVVRSATKLFAVPGLRAGWLVAAPPLAECFRAVRPPWSANALALAVLEAVAGAARERRRAATRAAERRADLAQRLADLDGVETFPGVAPFCLVRVPDGARVAARLRELGFAVRRCGNFAGLGDDFLRITARDPRANAKLVAALGRALADSGG